MRNIFTASLAFAALTLVTASASAQLATYDPSSGNLSLSGLGSDIGLDVQSTNNDLIGANGNANGAIYDTSLAPGTLSWLNFAGLTGDGNFDAGDILPTGLSGSNTPAPDALPGVSVFRIAGLGQQPTAVDVVVMGTGGGNTDPVADLANLVVDFLNGDSVSQDLDASGSSDADGDTLSFAFDVDGDGVFETDNGTNPILNIADVTSTFGPPSSATDKVFNIGVEVNDGNGGIDSTTATVTLVQVPEPAALALISLGLVGLAGRRRS